MAGALLPLVLSTPASTQINSLSAVLSVTPPQKVIAKRNETVPVDLRIDLRPGYHVNSDKPTDPYLIPLKITWFNGPVQAGDTIFPKPTMQKFEFSEHPLSVFENTFKLTTKIKVAQDAPVGPVKLQGKLRYQACNEKMCLPPRTLDVSVPVEIRN